jgi:DNA-binding NtrC family response regulator
LITGYHWPGNVRELKNVIERAMILTDQKWITSELLPFELKEIKRSDPSVFENGLPQGSEEMSLEGIEKIYISRVLDKLEWNKSKAAKLLGITRTTLREKIRRYQLSHN